MKFCGKTDSFLEIIGYYIDGSLRGREHFKNISIKVCFHFDQLF